MELAHTDVVDATTRAWWIDLCDETTRAMQDHCMRYLTPISHAVDDDWGALEGTGSYVNYEDKRLLLTNEHVLRDWRARQFAHQFHGCEDVFRLGHPLALENHPVDAAICVIEDSHWGFRPHAAEAVPAARIASRHAPAPGELIFVAGYPEKRSKSLYKNLISRATRLLTQVPPDSLIPDLHSNYFLLAYSPARAKSVNPANAVGLVDPHGMSGSLVWNTRRVECHAQGMTWSPDLAEVTGMLCRWDSPTSTVIAVRIEVIRDFLKRHAHSLS